MNFDDHGGVTKTLFVPESECTHCRITWLYCDEAGCWEQDCYDGSCDQQCDPPDLALPPEAPEELEAAPVVIHDPDPRGLSCIEVADPGTEEGDTCDSEDEPLCLTGQYPNLKNDWNCDGTYDCIQLGTVASNGLYCLDAYCDGCPDPDASLDIPLCQLPQDDGSILYDWNCNGMPDDGTWEQDPYTGEWYLL